MDKKLRIIKLISNLYRTGKITSVQKNKLATSLEKAKEGETKSFKEFFQIVTNELDSHDSNVKEITTLVFELS